MNDIKITYKMEVNFNDYRKRTTYDFNRLCDILNDNMTDDNEIRIDSSDMGELRNIMGDLRMNIVTLCCLESDEEEFKGIIDEVKIEHLHDIEEEF